MITIKEITVTSAEILDLHNTPVSLLAAPAAGYANNILGVTGFLDFNTTPYTGDQNLYIDYQSNLGVPIFQENLLLFASQEQKNYFKKYDAGGLVYSTIDTLTLSKLVAAASGDSNLILYIIYETVLIT